MAKQPKFKVGDKVTSWHWPNGGVFKIVLEIDGRFAIENHQVRAIAQERELTKIEDNE